MGMYPMRNPENCPKCGRSLKEEPKPVRPNVPGFPDGVAYGQDPACGGRWHVWDRTSPQRTQAQPYVEGGD